MYGASILWMMSLNRYVGGPMKDHKLNKVYLVDPFEKFVCNYSCRYCVLGRPISDNCPLSRDRFNRFTRQVEGYISRYGLRGVNALLISPYGEPTLLPELPQVLRILRSFGRPIAIYTNSSGLLDETTFNLLLNFDIVLFKLDTLYKDTMDRLNRPNQEIDPEDLKERLIRFRREYPKKMYLETMFVGGYNDTLDEAVSLISAVKEINPNKYFISIPYLPTSDGVRMPDKKVIEYIYEELSKYMPNRVFILDKPVEAPLNKKVDDPVEELIYISTLYPVRLEEAIKYFEEFGLDGRKTIEELVELGDVEVVEWLGIEYVVSITLSRMIKSG